MAKDKSINLSGFVDSSYMDNTPDGNQSISPFRFGSRDQRLYTNLGLQAQIEAQPKILAFEGDPTAPPPDNGFPVFAVETDVYSFDDTKNKLSGTPTRKYVGADVEEPVAVKVTNAGYGGAMMSTDPEMIEGIYVTSRQAREFLDTEGTPLQQIEDSPEQTQEEQFEALPRFGRGSAFNGFQTRMIGYGNGRDVNPELQGEYVTSQAAKEIFDTDGTPIDSIGKNGETEEQQFEDLPQFGRGGAFGKFERVHQNSNEHEADPEDFKADEIFNINDLSTIPRFTRPRTLHQQMTQFISSAPLGRIEVDDLGDNEYITTAEADKLYHPDGETIAQIAQGSRAGRGQRAPYPPFGEKGVFRNAPANDGLGSTTTSADIMRRSTQTVKPFAEFFSESIKDFRDLGGGKFSYKITNPSLFLVTLIAYAIASAPALLKSRPLSYTITLPNGNKKTFSSVIISAPTLESIALYNQKYREVGSAITSLITQLNRGEVLDPASFEQECIKVATPLLDLIALYNTIIDALFVSASERSLLADKYTIPSGFLTFKRTGLSGLGVAINMPPRLLQTNKSINSLTKKSRVAKGLQIAKNLSLSLRVGARESVLNSVENKLYNDARLSLGDIELTGAYKNFVYFYRDIVKVFLELPLISPSVLAAGKPSLLADLKEAYKGNATKLQELNGLSEMEVRLGAPADNGIVLPTLADVSAALVKQSQALRDMYEEELEGAVLLALSDYVGQASSLFNNLVASFLTTKETLSGAQPIILRALKEGIIEVMSGLLTPLEGVLADVLKAQQETGSKVVEVAGVRMDLGSYLTSAAVVENLLLVSEVIKKVKAALDEDESEINDAVSAQLGQPSVANAYRISLLLELAELAKLLISMLYVEANASGGVRVTAAGQDLIAKIDSFLIEANNLITQGNLADDVAAADDVIFSETEEDATGDDEYDELGLVIIDTEDGETLYWDKDGKIGAVNFVYDEESEIIGRYVDDVVIELTPIMYEDEIYYVDSTTGNVYTDENQVAPTEVRRIVLAEMQAQGDEDEDGADFEADVVVSSDDEDGEAESTDTTTQPEKPVEMGGSNTTMYVLGGLLLAGGAAWFLNSRAKAKK